MSWFPNLHKLTWHANGTRIFAPILRMALVPSMLVLNVEISLPPDYTFLSVLSSLGALCPYLQNMTFRIQHESEDFESSRQISPFIAQPISQLHHLHTVSVWDAGSEVLELVMKLRAIQSLSLDLRTSSAWDEKPRFQSPGFDCLKWFNISTQTVEHASNFFRSLRVVKSKQIKVDVTSMRTGWSPKSPRQILSEFFATLQERCDHDILEYFSLSIGYTKGLGTKSSVFTPLRAFSNLTHLLITGAGNISMSDKELCQLAKAWPRLQALKISHRKVSAEAPTFHGLINLIWCCPALTSLSLLIDTTKSEGIDPKCPGSGRCNKRLNFLALGNSPIYDPVNVALIISGLFPYLEQVDLGQSTSDKSQWAIVNNMLHGFNVARERRVESWSDCL
jgi:hypothetical protein